LDKSDFDLNQITLQVEQDVAMAQAWQQH